MLKLVFLSLLMMICASYAKEPASILNVSFDPPRELFVSLNKLFTEEHKTNTGKKIQVKQSHAGSSKQAQSVIYGLKADIVTLATEYDVDAIVQAGMIDENWRDHYPNNSSPYKSTIVFLVREGNPKSIKDWADLVRKDISVITPNPKTSGGARFNYIAAWIFANQKYNGDMEKTNQFIAKLYKNVPILDTGARGAAITFIEREIGDVLITWESEAMLAAHHFNQNQFDLIMPSITVDINLPVAVVKSVAKQKSSEKLGKEYVNFLFTDKGQEIFAQHFYRPINEYYSKQYNFPEINSADIEEYGGFDYFQQQHFNNGGIFDQIYKQP